MSNANVDGERKEHDVENDNSESNEEDEPEYEVEAILGVKAFPKENQLKYRISWVGYGTEYDSWEPEDNLGGAEDALNAFRKTHLAEMNRANKIIENYQKKHSAKQDHRASSSSVSPERRSSPGKKKQMGRPPFSVREERESSSSGDDDFVPAKKAKRGRQQGGVAGTSTADGSPQYSPRKRRNSWMYQDFDEDTDGDAPDSTQEKRGVRNQEKEAPASRADSGATEVIESSPAGSGGTPDEEVQVVRAPATQPTPLQAITTNENVAPNGIISGRQPPEERDHFIGCIKMPSGMVQMLRSVGGRTELIPMREAHERFGYEVVEYLIGRAEFVA